MAHDGTTPQIKVHDGIGASVRRKEDRRFLTGRGQYIHDVRRTDQLHAVFLRSPHAHAAILNIDTTDALKAPGVIAVYTGQDLAAAKVGGVPCAWGIVGRDGKPMKEPPHPPLALGKVRYVGDTVAVVIAESVDAARDAAERITVEYKILPSV